MLSFRYSAIFSSRSINFSGTSEIPLGFPHHQLQNAPSDTISPFCPATKCQFLINRTGCQGSRKTLCVIILCDAPSALNAILPSVFQRPALAFGELGSAVYTRYMAGVRRRLRHAVSLHCNHRDLSAGLRTPASRPGTIGDSTYMMMTEGSISISRVMASPI